MQKVTRERALQLFRSNVEVFRRYDDNTDGLVLSKADIIDKNFNDFDFGYEHAGDSTITFNNTQLTWMFFALQEQIKLSTDETEAAALEGIIHLLTWGAHVHPSLPETKTIGAWTIQWNDTWKNGAFVCYLGDCLMHSEPTMEAAEEYVSELMARIKERETGVSDSQETTHER